MVGFETGMLPSADEKEDLTEYSGKKSFLKVTERTLAEFYSKSQVFDDFSLYWNEGFNNVRRVLDIT